MYRLVPVLREMGYTTIVASTFSRLVRAESKIRSYVDSQPQRLYEKRPPILTLPEVDSATAQWVIQKLSTNRARLTGDMICEKARQFCRLLGYPDDTLAFSNGWLERFKTRMGLSRHIFHGEAASAPIERIEDETYRMVSMICWYTPDNVLNCDETALPWCLVPNCGLAIENMPGVKLGKKRVTFMLCANMTGTNKRMPLIIGRAKKPRCFGNRMGHELGFYYFWNSKAWMVHSIWKQ
ncbi:hypothetical protein FRC08_004519 [Ceratobasidium sp. 394]|nr:hypothetical protein FRC08_004519 [Ceratobasidium sp. 394]